MFGNQIRGAICEIGIGGKIDAASIALRAVVSYDAISYFGWAFQQQAPTAFHIVIEAGEIPFNEATVNL